MRLSLYWTVYLRNSLSDKTHKKGELILVYKPKTAFRQVLVCLGKQNHSMLTSSEVTSEVSTGKYKNFSSILNKILPRFSKSSRKLLKFLRYKSIIKYGIYFAVEIWTWKIERKSCPDCRWSDTDDLTAALTSDSRFRDHPWKKSLSSSKDFFSLNSPISSICTRK